jgi:hypothetical protein
MKIHPETHLFMNLTPDELNEITAWAENLALHNIRVPEPAWVAEWCSVTGRTDVLTYALLSVVRIQNIEWVADHLEGPNPKKRPSPPAPDFDEDELSERDRKARTMAKLLSPDAICDLHRVCQAISPIQLDLAEGLEGYELVQRLRHSSPSLEPHACWPTPYGRRVHAWLVALDKVPLPPEPPTLERITLILERAGHPPGSGSFLERIRSFAIDWFAHFTSYVVPDEDVDLIRRATEFYNTHQRWPWEPASKTR